METQTKLEAGALIQERYRIVSPLGEGAMGAVFLAHDTQLGREVAVKVLQREWISRPDVRQRLENECQILARVGSHPHIVTLYDRLSLNGDIVLVMEYVAGESLAAIIARAHSQRVGTESMRKTTPIAAGISTISLEPREALEIARQCLAALDFAHSRDILHRDIKPANIMVMRDHNGNLVAKLMDFGIGKALQGTDMKLTRTDGPGPGTPAYMAPEQIDPSRFGPVGKGADLYALGVTLYEMMTLSLPFEGNYFELMQAHTTQEPPDPRKRNPMISAETQAILAKALRKEMRNRYQTASEFARDLEGAAYGTGTVISGPSGGTIWQSAPQPKERVGRKPLFAMLGLILAATLGFAAYLALVKPIPPTPPRTEGEMPPPPLPPLSLEADKAREVALAAQKDADIRLANIPDKGAAYASGVKSMVDAEKAFTEGRFKEAIELFGAAQTYFVAPQPPQPTPEQDAAQHAKQFALMAKGKAAPALASNVPAKMGLYGEAETLMTQAETAMKEGRYTDAKDLFGQARVKYEKALEEPDPAQREASALKTEAEAERNKATGRGVPNKAPGLAEGDALMKEGDDAFAKGDYVTANVKYGAGKVKYASLTPPPPPVPPDNVKKTRDEAIRAKDKARERIDKLPGQDFDNNPSVLEGNNWFNEAEKEMNPKEKANKYSLSRKAYDSAQAVTPL